MDTSLVLDQCLALLSGELHESTGAVLTAPGPHPLVAQPGDAGRATVVATLSAGGRVVIPVEPAASAGVARIAGWLTSRRRVARARRWLTAAGATRVRVLAVVARGRESLFLVYELGGSVQPYVEHHVVLRTQGESRWVAVVKAVVSRIIGADISVSLLVVVGERR